MDAVLKADLGSEHGPPESTRAEGTFVDLRDKVSALPSQVGQVSDDVALLEILLDLALAQTRATLGEVSAAQSRVVAMRVAAAVLLRSSTMSFRSLVVLFGSFLVHILRHGGSLAILRDDRT